MRFIEKFKRSTEEQQMKTKTVKFYTTDGSQPKRSTREGRPWDLVLANDVIIPPHFNRKLGLGLNCNVPVLLVRHNSVSMFAPTCELVVDIHNDTDSQLVLGRGEVVAQAFVVDNSNLELA